MTRSTVWVCWWVSPGTALATLVGGLDLTDRFTAAVGQQDGGLAGEAMDRATGTRGLVLGTGLGRLAAPGSGPQATQRPAGTTEYTADNSVG